MCALVMYVCVHASAVFAIFSLLFSNLRPIISTDGMRLHAAVCEAGARTLPSW